jgi:FMN-dependent NADH-azoreductase
MKYPPGRQTGQETAMIRLLHIQASPRLFGSASIRTGTALVESFLKSHPTAGVEALNLFTNPPPEFGAPEAAVKYGILAGQQMPNGEARAWEKVVQTITHFLAFDYYVISAGMWNFGIPWRLKQYIDVIVQPGLTFDRMGEGYRGLADGRKAALVLARGGAYGPGTANETLDYQKSYLQSILGFIGITDIRCILVEPTLTSDPEPTLLKAIQEARDLGANW